MKYGTHVCTHLVHMFEQCFSWGLKVLSIEMQWWLSCVVVFFMKSKRERRQILIKHWKRYHQVVKGVQSMPNDGVRWSVVIVKICPDCFWKRGDRTPPNSWQKLFHPELFHHSDYSPLAHPPPRTNTGLGIRPNAVQSLEHQPQSWMSWDVPKETAVHDITTLLPFAFAVAVAAVRGHRLLCISPERRRPCAWHIVPPISNDSTRPQRGHQ